MPDQIHPHSVNELVEAVRAFPRVLAIGSSTKPRLSAVDGAKVCIKGLSGIIEYEPSEFTFTALAGTPIAELNAVLAEKGQCMPFDPMCARAGATLGGTVAAGLNGPGRFRFGGLRDFILGVKFVDGLGRLLRLGGKVVKNAAGFDVPKFMVGSLGRFGVLAEITFKVFPQPAATLTLKLPVESFKSAAQIMVEIANSRWQADALDVLPDARSLCVRLAGPAEALEEISPEILSRWPGEVLAGKEAEAVWDELKEFSWVSQDGPLVKVSLTPAGLTAFADAVQAIDGIRFHVSAAGNVAFVSLASPGVASALDQALRKLQLSAVTLRGNAPLWCGIRPRFQIEGAVKEALDPQHRFPDLDEKQ